MLKTIGISAYKVIKEIVPSQNSGYIDLKILNHNTDQIGTARNQDPINVRKYIDAYR